MKNKLSFAVAVALVSTLILGVSANAETTQITGQGSSFAGNIITTCSTTYPGSSVAYSATGSGTGRTAFLNNLNDFVASDVPYGQADKQPAADSFTYIPVIGGAVAFIYNLPSAYGIKALKLTSKVASNIFNGTITKWNDASIVALNPTAKLPAKDIKVFYRGSSSGTTQNVAKYFIANGNTTWTDNGGYSTAIGKEIPGNFNSAGTSALLVDGVDDTSFSIGYVDLSDAVSRQVSYALLKNQYGQFIKPSVTSASLFLKAQTVSSNGIVNINFKAKVKGGYNLSIITYVLAYTGPAQKDAVKQSKVNGFVKYILKSCGLAKGSKLGYVALSGKVKDKALALSDKIK
jgi:phosphate transport system substrate-binding protein